MEYSGLECIEFEGIDHSDYPDYVDAFISYAEYEGRPLTEYELEEINDDRCFVYDCLMEYLH